jgi:hypothetical protein
MVHLTGGGMYRAYGWVAGIPSKPEGEAVKYYGPVAGVRSLTPVPRQVVAAASGFNEEAWGSSRRQSTSEWTSSSLRWDSTSDS